MLTEIRKNADGLNAQCNCVVYAVDGMCNLYHVKKSHMKILAVFPQFILILIVW